MRTHALSHAVFGASLVLFLGACGGKTGGTVQDAGPELPAELDGGILASLTVVVAPDQKDVAEGADETVAIAVSGAEGAVTLQLRSAPTWATLQGNTLRLKPLYRDAGRYTLLVSAKDGKGAVGFGALQVTVTDVKREPAISEIAFQTVKEGETKDVALVGSDPDGETLTWDIAQNPGWASIVDNGGGPLLKLAPGFDVVSSGSQNIILFVKATNASGKSAQRGVTVTVTHQNRKPVMNAPVLSMNAQNRINENESDFMLFSATDLDGTTVFTYNLLDTLPAFIVPATSGGSVTVSPTYADGNPSPEKTYTFRVTASDGTDVSDPVTVTLTVVHVNAPPSFVASSIAQLNVTEGVPQSRPLECLDVDGDNCVFGLGTPAPPAWIQIANGTLSASPDFADITAAESPKDFTVPLTVSDGTVSRTATMVVRVTHQNRSPTVGTVTFAPAVTNSELAELAGPYTATLAATDPDGDALTWSNTGSLPAWGTFNQANGTFTLTPTTGHATSTPVVFNYTVSDGSAPIAGSFSLTVKSTNTAPTVTNLRQLDGGVDLPGGAAADDPPLLQATLSDAQSHTMKLEAEVVPATSAFTGTPTVSGGTFSSAAVQSLSLSTLPAGPYKWQVRAVDSVGATSPWTQFGSDPAFVINVKSLGGEGLKISSGAQFTKTLTVALSLNVVPSTGATMTGGTMSFSQDDQQTFTTPVAFDPNVSPFTLVGAEGNRTVWARVCDSLNVCAVFSDDILFDQTAPNITTFTINGTSTWTNSAAVTLNVVASDDRSGLSSTYLASNDGVTFATVSGATTNWTLASGDGSKVVSVRVSDQAGNVAQSNAGISLDTTPPQVSAVTLKSGAPYTNNIVVELAHTATDTGGSGVFELCRKNDGETEVCAAWVSSMMHGLRSADGLRTVSVRVKDVAGNSSPSLDGTITLDRLPPTLGGNIFINALTSGGYLRTSSATMTTNTPSDLTSPVATIGFSVNGGARIELPVAGSNNTYALSFSAPDGLVSIDAKVKDAAGNESGATPASTVTLDTVDPVGQSFVLGTSEFTQSTSVLGSLSATDNTSGLADYCVRFIAGAPTDTDTCWRAVPGGTTSAFTANIELPSTDGLITGYAWFRDRAGRATTTARTDTITLDRTPPTLNDFVIAAGAQWTNTFTPLGTVSVTDNLGAANVDTLCLGTVDPPTNCAALASPATIQLPAGDGVKTIYAQVKDKAGHVSNTRSDSISVDTSPPVITSFVLGDGGLYTTQATTNATVTSFDDGGSGVAGYAIAIGAAGPFGAWTDAGTLVVSFAASPNGNYDVFVKAIDVAGNESRTPHPLRTITWDNQAPDASIIINNNAPYTNQLMVGLTITATDNVGGVARYCVADVTPRPATCVWSAFPPVSSSLIGEGTKAKYLYVEDFAGNGNTNGFFDTIIRDVTPPTTPSVTATAGHRRLDFDWTTSTDNLSGISGYQVAFGTTQPTTASYVPNTSKPMLYTQSQGRPLQNGRPYYFDVRAVDGAGNASTTATYKTYAPVWPFSSVNRLPTSLDLTTAISFSSSSDGLVAGFGGTVFTSTNDAGTPFVQRDALFDGHWLGGKRDDAPDSGVENGATLVGERGAMAQTFDKGVTFETIPAGTTNDLFGHASFHANGSEYAIAVGANGTILRSVRPSGSTGPRGAYVPVSGIPSTVTFRAVTVCTNTSQCGTFGGNCLVAAGTDGTDGVAYFSTNGGQNWTQQPTAALVAHLKEVRSLTYSPGRGKVLYGGAPKSNTNAPVLEGSCHSSSPAIGAESVFGNSKSFSVYAVSAAGSGSVYFAAGRTINAAGDESGPDQVFYVDLSAATGTLVPAGGLTPRALSVTEGVQVWAAGVGGTVFVRSGLTTPVWSLRTTGKATDFKGIAFNTDTSGSGDDSFGAVVGTPLALRITDSGGQGASLWWDEPVPTGVSAPDFIGGISQPALNNTLIAAGRQGVGVLFRDDPSSATWSELLVTGFKPFNAIACATVDTSTKPVACVAAGVEGGMVRLEGTPPSYTATTITSPVAGGADALAVAVDKNGKFWVTYANGSYRHDRSGSWSSATILVAGEQFTAVAVDQDNPDVVLIGGTRIQRTITGGASGFTQYSFTPSAQVRSLASAGAGVFYGALSDGRLFKTTDSGQSFSPLSTNFGSMTINALLVPAKSRTDLFVVGRNGGVYFSGNGGQ